MKLTTTLTIAQLWNVYFSLRRLSLFSPSFYCKWSVVVKSPSYETCYRPQTKFAKVMFSLVSVCPYGWGCLPHCMLGYTPPGRHPPGQRPPTQTPHWADTPSPGPQADTPRTVHAGIRSTSGRQASHWNAFLFYNVIRDFMTCVGDSIYE